MKRIVTIAAASAVISAALVGGLAAAGGQADLDVAAARTATGWTDPPAREECQAGCLSAVPERKVRVIPIDGRDWTLNSRAPAPRTAAR